MNKHLYRIIFNKARGLLMVVAEIASAGREGGRRVRRSKTALRQCRLSSLSCAMLALFGSVVVVNSAQAGIVADGQAPNNQQPNIVNTANGTPQVNIQTPSEGGVSRNTYSQFDVDQKGAILNNSRNNVATQQGGMVQGNPWLARGEAKVILNEVNSRDPSQLNGYVEVAGRQAQVVIANPAGITCNGCGFINANRATMTTGQAQLNNGQLTGFDVERGEIVIQGAGMDSSRQDYTDIIARSVKINASLVAKDLKVTAGRNKVDVDHQQIDKKAADGSARPMMAVDVAQLGGMYANKIRLIGTEDGVGVHNAGNIGAQAGSLVVTADGRIENSGQMSGRDGVRVATNGAIENSGAVRSEADANLTAAGDLHNSGAVSANNHLQTQSATLNSEQGSVLAAGVNQDGKLAGSGNLTLDASGQLRAQGQNLASGDLSARGQGVDVRHSSTSGNNITLDAGREDLQTGGAQVAAQQQLTASSGKMLNNDGGSLLGNKLNIKADSLSNQQGSIAQLGSDSLQLSHKGSLNNRGGSIASNGKDLKINAAKINNQGGKILHAAEGELALNSSSLQGERGQLLSNGELTINSGEVLLDGGTTSAEKFTLTASRLSNREGSILQTGSGAMTLNVFDGVDNQAGKIAGNGTLDLQTTSLNNQQGQIGAGENFTLHTGTLSNQQGSITTLGDLQLNSVGLNNDGGLVQSGGSMALDLQGGSLSNRNSGDKRGIVSRGAMSINSGSLDNQQGFIAASGDLQLASAEFNNLNGTLASDGELNLTTGQFNNQQGLVQAGKNLDFNTQKQSLDNRNGTLSAGNSLSLLTGALLNQAGQIRTGGNASINTQGQTLDNAQGNIVANGNAQLDIAGLNNQGGKLQAAGNAVINAFKGLVDNTAGLIRSGATATVNAAQTINRNTKTPDTGLEGQSVRLISDSLDNTQGALRANDQLDISTSVLDNSQGLLSSADTITLAGNGLELSNTGGTLIADKNLQLSASSLTGDGSLLSQGAMTLNVAQGFSNQGQVIANGDLNFTIGQRLENSALIKAGGTLNLNAASINNGAAGEISAAQNHILTPGDVTNRGLIDGNLTHIQSSTLTNIGSGRIYGDHIALQTGTLNNLAENGIAATIAARQRLDIGAQTINNRDHGLIFSAGDVAVGGQLNDQWQATGQASVFNNNSSTLESAGNMVLNISQINNLNDHFETQVVVTEDSAHHEAVLKGSIKRYDWDDVDTSWRNKYKVHDAIMPDGTRGNEFYEYQYQRTVTETQITHSDPGQIIAGGDLTIYSSQLNNINSRVMAGGTFGGQIDIPNNFSSPGERVTTDVGTQTRWYAKKTKRRRGGTKTSQGKDGSDYRPEPVVQSIDLKAMVYQDHASITGSGTSIAGRDTATTSQQAGSAGAVGSGTTLQPITPPAGQIFEIQPKNSLDSVVRLTSPNITLPDNSLFQLHGEVTSHYLIETDPRFANRQEWLSSDYMQNALRQNSDHVLKRLGDGFYEQRLIRQQIADLTGQRYLAGYSNDAEQYKALMNAGINFGKDYNLTLGVALTPTQMALLTSDMVWLVKQDVTLPNGSVQSVLVPQVYARVKKGDLDGSGALLSGNNVVLNSEHDLTNSGKILGREVTQINADTLNNGGFIGGNKVNISARTDINNLGGTLQGGDSLVAIAGRDINVSSTLTGNDTNRYLDRAAGIYVQSDGGKLGLQALNNINLTAAQVSNAGADSQTKIIAGNDLNLATLNTTHTENSDWGKDNYRHLTQNQDVGTQINVGGSLGLSAANNLNAQAASVTAKDSITAVAGNDINLTAGNDAYHLTEHSKQSSKGMLSSMSLETHDEVRDQSALGSNISGESVTLQAGNNLLVQGSNLAGTGDVNLLAGHDLSITAADQSRQENHLREEKKTGLSGTGGVGVSYGKQSTKITDDGKTQSSAGSTVGSTQGNVNLSAGNALTVKGSDVLGGKDLNLVGKEVNILAADNQSVQTHTVEQKQSGLTLALSGAVGSAINSAVSSANDASTASSGRLAALDGIKSALGGVQAYQASQLGEAQGEDQQSLFGVNLSYGSQSSKSEQTQTNTQSQGSSLTAGNNLNIRATDTDINVQGSQLQAGKDIGLMANRDVNLISATNTSVLDGKNESHGGSVGVGINFGKDTGFTVSASANKGKGSESGNGVTHTETTLNAGNNLNIASGRDTTLTGAQLTGDKVTMDVGRNLTLTSEQDSDNYDSKQQNASAGGSFTFGSMSGSAGVNLSKDKMHSTYSSVQEQTGIFAGKGGFDITVGEHTQLNGAVIGSTADASKNRLDTGTLGFGDIENQADYQVEHQSVGISTGGNIGSQFVGNMANSLLVGVNGKGSDSSTTKSAVSDGTIIIRDDNKQTQNVAELSRDVEHANQTLSPIFDKEKEQRRLQEAQKIGEIGTQVMDIARTQGDINGLKAAKADEKYANLTADELRKTDVYKAEMAKYGTGSAIQQGLSAATAAIQGLAGGNMAKAIAGGSAPYLAEVIHNMTTDPVTGKVNTEANLMAHAVVGAVVAQINGNSALAGASGAATGEFIAQQLYPNIKREDLTEEQRQTISSLSTLAAGLAGGLTGDSSADAVEGAQAGKTAVENNALSLPSGMMDYGQSVASYAQYAQDNNLPPDQVKSDMERMVKGDLPEGADIIKAILENNPGTDTVMALLSAEDAKDYALALLSSIPAERVLSMVGKAAKVIDNKIIIKTAERISTAKAGTQFTAPRDLNEQVLWNQVNESPTIGKKLDGMNNDPRFPVSAGFQKMEAKQKLSDGSTITMHYQYNATTGKAYDMKITTPQRAQSDPQDVIDNIRGKVQ